MSERINEDVLYAARKLTACDRWDDYGHPKAACERIAHLWNGVLADKLRDDAQITAADVPLCMIVFKVAREVHQHKRDNVVDIAGYARVAAIVAGDEPAKGGGE